MRKFSESLNRTCKKYNNWFWKEKILLLTTTTKKKSYQETIECHIYIKRSIKKFAKNKNHGKVGHHCHYTGKCRRAVQSICNLRFNAPNEIPVIFQNGSNYDYYFLIKHFPKEFEGQIKCLGDNTGKY